ncbi:MAG: GTP 3',8-cyclase MoaA [Desulfuromonadales bacterium]|nr:GTP 3',8-cyclase MoaA [Desulfuromonadales bacterium]
MKDQFNRTIEYLRLSITDRCNLRCRYCMPEEGVVEVTHGTILSYEELLAVAAVAARLGVRQIRVTGGEPLVRRGVIDFIRQLAQLPERPEVTMTTNGLRLAEEVEALCAAGLQRVNVSLDTLRPERFMQITRRDGLEQVLAGIRAATVAGLPVKINMVPIASVNDDEIHDFARLAEHHPWDIRFIEYMPFGPELDFPPELRVPADVIIARLRELGPLEPLHKDSAIVGPAHHYRLPGWRGRLGVIPAVSNHFCAACNRLRITADGRIKPCLFEGGEYTLKPALRPQIDPLAIEKLLLGAACAKPERHRINEDDYLPPTRGMHGIGG